MGKETFEPDSWQSNSVKDPKKTLSKKRKVEKVVLPDVVMPDEKQREAMRIAVLASTRAAYEAFSQQFIGKTTIPLTSSDTEVPLPPELPIFHTSLEVPPLLAPLSTTNYPIHSVEVQGLSREQLREILRDYYEKLAIVCSAMPDDSDKILKKVWGLTDQEYKERTQQLLASLPSPARVMLYSKEFKKLPPQRQQEVISQQFRILGSDEDLQLLNLSPEDLQKARASASFLFVMENPSGPPVRLIMVKRYSNFYKPLVDLTPEKLSSNQAKYTVMAALMHEIGHQLMGGEEPLPYLLEIAILEVCIQRGLLKVDTSERSKEVKTFIDNLAIKARADSNSNPQVEESLKGLYAAHLKISTQRTMSKQ